MDTRTVMTSFSNGPSERPQIPFPEMAGLLLNQHFVFVLCGVCLLICLFLWHFLDRALLGLHLSEYEEGHGVLQHGALEHPEEIRTARWPKVTGGPESPCRANG